MAVFTRGESGNMDIEMIVEIFLFFQFIGATAQGPPPGKMPAIGINITDNNGAELPITTPIAITLPNLEQNVNSSRSYSGVNLTRGMTIHYVLGVESMDEALVVEIEDG